MRFAVGQAFESAVSGRQAVVTETRDDGHAGHLAFSITAKNNGFFGRSFFMKESGFRLV